MAGKRSNDDTTSPPESHSGLQGEGGPGRSEGRQNAGRVGGTVRRSPQPDYGLEGAAAVFGEDKAEEQSKVDVTRMQAKIGELALANVFLESALTKAGLLSAKR